MVNPMSKYFNIFYSYGGKNDHQFEMNVTRSLINVLHLLSQERRGGSIYRSFVRQFCVNNKKEMERFRESPFHKDKIDIALEQLLPENIHPKKGKYLLFIRPPNVMEDITREKYKKTEGKSTENRYDAWIKCGNHTLIVIESKIKITSSEQNKVIAQLKKYCDSDHIYIPYSHIKQKTWRNVLDFFNKHSDDNVIVKEFCKYLELCGITGFSGFHDENLNFLALDAVDQKSDENDKLRKQLSSDFFRFIGEIYQKQVLNKKNSYLEYEFEQYLHYPKKRNKHDYLEAYFAPNRGLVNRCVNVRHRQVLPPV